MDTMLPWYRHPGRVPGSRAVGASLGVWPWTPAFAGVTAFYHPHHPHPEEARQRRLEGCAGSGVLTEGSLFETLRSLG